MTEEDLTITPVGDKKVNKKELCTRCDRYSSPLQMFKDPRSGLMICDSCYRERNSPKLGPI